MATKTKASAGEKKIFFIRHRRRGKETKVPSWYIIDGNGPWTKNVSSHEGIPGNWVAERAWPINI